MASAAEPNLFDIPPSALRPSTVMALSSMLNPPKVIPTENGLPRDWRGLVHLMEVPRHLQPHSSSPDPTADLLKRWSEGSLGQLLQFFKQMDRWDVVDDMQSTMESDAVVYVQKLAKASSAASTLSDDIEKQILTSDDVLRLERGLPPQHYNAYLLYADPDEEFAVRIIEEMEQKYGLKLCVKDRDLVGGHMFQHEAIMKLISERCNRLIVVISEDFLKSEANKFFCTFAQALGIEHKRRKVIPVMHSPCRLPPELNYFFVLDYTRSGQLWNFWEKLRDSIETPSAREDSSIRISGTSSLMLQSQEATPDTSRAALLEQSSRTAASTEQDVEKPKSTTDSSRNIKIVMPEGVRLKKSSRSISLENVKARSKKLFGSFPNLSKKNKKRSPEPVPC